MYSALIFVCSDQPEPYLNVLTYLADKRGTSQFTFVFITGAMMEGPQTSFVDTLISNIDELANGRYRGRQITTSEEVRKKYAMLASNLRSNPNLTKVIALEELADLISSQISKNRQRLPIIDVTGLPKILAAHVMLICLAEGHPVHAFELRDRVDRRRPELSLYFSLPSGAFDYSQLTRDPAVQASLRRLIPLRKIMWAITAALAIGMGCFTTLIFLKPDNIIFSLIGIAANLIGIIGGVSQIISMRTIHTPKKSF